MRPVVLVGETRSARNLATLAALDWGRMFVTERPTPFAGEKWGFDNGAFGAYCRGLAFPRAAFLRRLEAAELVAAGPYLAVAPDRVAGGLRSLEFSEWWMSRGRLPDDWPWYLAVQDGMSPADVEPCARRYSGLFLGGTDQFKRTAPAWARLARRCGIRFHYGRASTPSMIGLVGEVGADSCDSAFPLWTDARMAAFVAAWRAL